MRIPFNKPFLTGKETTYIQKAVSTGHISGNGDFTKKVHDFFETTYGFKNRLLTNSCTDALEMASLLIDIKPGDEIIIPSFTFVSTANAFVLRGANIIFADSEENNPNIDANKIEELITQKTKAIVPVHYAGVACNMDKIMNIAKINNLYVIEDAAQAIDSYYKGKPIGTIGDLSTFSFHETKNIMAGEGGMLVINNEEFRNRSEIIWEKGTNRASFWRGEVNKYDWVDVGSSYLPSDMIAAFLFAQLENLEQIQEKRISIWSNYADHLKELEINGYIKLPDIPEYATNNGHIFYFQCESMAIRDNLIDFLNKNGINAVFHYLPLHQSPYYQDKYNGCELVNAVKFSNQIIRLPIFYELSDNEIGYIAETIKRFFKSN